MCHESCYMSFKSWYVKERKEQVKTMYMSSWEWEWERGKWGLIGGKHGVLWTFLLDSQPLIQSQFISFHYVDYKLSLYTMVKMGKLAYMRGGYVQFSPRMCRKLQPLVGFDSKLKIKFNDDVMIYYYL